MKTLQYSPQGGRRLEDSYGEWLAIFQEVAEAPNDTVSIRGAPPEWEELLWYLGAGKGFPSYGWKRSDVEHACAVEPVLVDALWRADMVWKGGGPHSDLRRHIWETEFPIATYSGFWRPEVMQYITCTLPVWKPTKKKCVLVPCAADKGYPSPLHKAVREVVGGDYHIIVATGVLGLVPDDLWDKMPYYDAGLPFEARLMEIAEEFFLRHTAWQEIVVYSDFNARALYKALGQAGQFARYVLGSGRRLEYENLLDPKWLARLKEHV